MLKRRERSRPREVDLTTLRVPDEILVRFSRSLAMMSMAGVHLGRALEHLSFQPECRPFGLVVEAVYVTVSGGKRLSHAFAQFPRIFFPVYVNMVKVGETHGALSESLNEVADYMEKDIRIKRRAKSTLSQPVLVFGVACVLSAIACEWLLPHFVESFEELRVELPLLTRALVLVVTLTRTPWFVLLFVTALALMFYNFRKSLATESGRLEWDRRRTEIPIFGKLFQKMAMVRFLRAMAALTSSGVSHISALELAAGAAGNEWLRRHVAKIGDAVTQGTPLSTCLRKSPVFESIVAQMVFVGEETGHVDRMFARLAHYYDLEVDYSLDAIAAILEPALMVITSLMVGGLILSIFLPYYSLVASL